MKISADKTKLMTNNINAFQKEIKLKGHKLGTVGVRWISALKRQSV